MDFRERPFRLAQSTQFSLPQTKWCVSRLEAFSGMCDHLQSMLRSVAIDFTADCFFVRRVFKRRGGLVQTKFSWSKRVRPIPGHQDKRETSEKQNKTIFGSIVLCLASPTAHWRKFLSEKKNKKKSESKKKIFGGENEFFFPKIKVAQNCLSCPQITFQGGGGSCYRQSTDIVEWQVESRC